MKNQNNHTDKVEHEVPRFDLGVPVLWNDLDLLTGGLW